MQGITLDSRVFLVGIALIFSIIVFTGSPDTAQAEGKGPLLNEISYILPESPGAYLENMMSGGPPKDGIPSIDNPSFIDAQAASRNLMDPGDIVIGYEQNGIAKAYPQKILVQHEIVNDVIDGENISITYCPLTATAQGFKRGSTTLGVSGRLINSNLVMYDRKTDSFYPQILATGIQGKNTGKTLKEFNVIWTTWDRWKQKFPNTKVLSTKTGYLRSYNRDPYGQYNPRGGYYQSNRTMFPLMEQPGEYSAKRMVLGARTNSRSIYVPVDELRENRILRTQNFIAVYDETLNTGYIYSQNSDAFSNLEFIGSNKYKINGSTYGPSELPLEKHVSVEGFYFAWNAYYPNSETI